MPNTVPEVTYKAVYRDGDIYELESFAKKKSVTGKKLTISLEKQLVSLKASEDRLLLAKTVYEGYITIVRVLKKAKKKGPK